MLSKQSRNFNRYFNGTRCNSQTLPFYYFFGALSILADRFSQGKKLVEGISLTTKELELIFACEEWITLRPTAQTFLQSIYEQKLSKTKSLERLYFHLFFSWPTLPGPPAASDTTAFELYFLRWLKTVSSTFQDVDFDGSQLPLFISWCYNHGIKKLPNYWWTRWYYFRDH